MTEDTNTRKRKRKRFINQKNLQLDKLIDHIIQL
jgi:hypothetical protein